MTLRSVATRCSPPYPLAIGHLTRDAAERLGNAHLAKAHGGAR